MDRGIKREGFAVIAVLLFCTMAIIARAATITVTNTNDSGPGSLRQALVNANNGDTIDFAVTGTIQLTSEGILIARNVTISGPGADQLAIDGNQAEFVLSVSPQITAAISGLTVRNGYFGIYNQQGRLSVSNCVVSGNTFAGLYNLSGQGSLGASMTVANCILTNNAGTGAFNGVTPTVAHNSGGPSSGNLTCACMTITDSVASNNAENGIVNAGSYTADATARLTVINSNVHDNDWIGIGSSGELGNATATIARTTVTGNSLGGVSSSGLPPVGSFGQLTITKSTISGNAAFVGGGINSYGSFLTVADSTISGNSAERDGGGIYANGFLNGPNVSIVNSTISGNSSADNGGGIYADYPDNFSIVNSTISGNSTGTSGGGIYNAWSSLHVANSTITGNSAGSGGGIYNNHVHQLAPVVEISNTILNAGALGENIFNSGGTVTSDGYNLSSDDGAGYLTGPGDQINTDPLLGPLQDNGGPTFTHALLPGSPAIDAGDPNFTPPPFNDQRGCPFDRVFNGRIDIGSFETQPPPGRPCPTPRPRPTSRPRPSPR
jgi:predicted outer membrane repeat protein